MRVKVKDLNVGDKIYMESGEIKIILKISSGFYHNSKILDLERGEWICETNNKEFQIINPPQ